MTALLSLALGEPVAPGTCMTGEVTVTGQVLPVGGIKEKCMAAQRAGATQVILPEANREEFEDAPAEVRGNLRVHFAKHYRDVFEAAFPGFGLREKDSSGAAVRGEAGGVAVNGGREVER